MMMSLPVPWGVISHQNLIYAYKTIKQNDVLKSMYDVTEISILANKCFSLWEIHFFHKQLNEFDGVTRAVDHLLSLQINSV